MTFSVAAIVRSATSRRISPSARRVSCSISRRVCSIISSRCFLASDFDSSAKRSDDWRARWTMSSACSRASFSRSRYSWSSSSASSRLRRAASIDSATALARFSSAAWIRGNASRLRMKNVARNAISVQIINPRPGETRKLPPSSSAAPPSEAASSRMFC